MLVRAVSYCTGKELEHGYLSVATLIYCVFERCWLLHCTGVFSRLKAGDARWNETAAELPYYRAFHEVAAKYKRELWSTTEIFWYPDGLEGTTHPAPMQRIAGQLVGEGEACSKLTSFAWQNMSPFRSNESARLYGDYQRWLHGGGGGSGRIESSN